MSYPDCAILADLRVLFVEDDADTRDLLAYALMNEGAEVVTVESASKALEVFNRERFDVLVSDAGLPGEDGWSLIGTIRRMTPENGGHIRAIALTGYAYPDDEARSLAAGFDVHITKPAELSLVVATIARLVGRPDPAPRDDENATKDFDVLPDAPAVPASKPKPARADTSPPKDLALESDEPDKSPE